MSRFWNFFIDKYRFTYLLTAVVVLLGFVSAIALPKESDPEVTVPIGVVTTVYPGASPLDVEELITNEIEDELNDLEDLETFTSTSAEGVSSIVVEFDPRADIDGRIRALKDAVDDAVQDLPGEAERPVVNQVSVNDEPIVVISIAIDLSQEALKEVGNELQDELEKIAGVSEAKIIGVRNREIQVTADLSKLETYQLSVRDLVTALQQHDAKLPVGAIEQNNISYTVRFEGGIDQPEIISSIPITTVGGTPVNIGDVATVTDGLQATSSYSRLSLGGEQARASIGIEIFKNDGNDAIGVVTAVKAEIEVLKGNLLQGADVYYSQDKAERIQEDLANLLSNGIQTVIIVFLLLYLFLGFREAVLAGLCIPLTFLMTFLGLYVFGFTINFLSLFSLILSLGILVDSSIVIVEGMHKYLYLGEKPAMAAKKTILEFQAPVVSGLFTTISAFVPMMFASGVTGQFIRVIPVTVIMVLMSSLFVGLAIIPMVGSRFLKTKDLQGGTVTEEDSQMKFVQALSRWYEVKLQEMLENTKLRRIFMAVLGLLFIGSMALPISGLLESVLFPKNDSDQVFVGVEMPAGTRVDETDRIVRILEEYLYEDKRIDSFVSSTGSSGGQSARNSGSNGNTGRISITLVDEDERSESSDEISQELRQLLPSVAPEATITFSQINAGPPQGSPVEITFRGEDIRELERLAYDTEQILKKLDGPVDVSRSTQDTPFEFAFVINRGKAAQTGLTPLAIAQSLRTALFGIDAIELKLKDEDVDVVVQLNLNPYSEDPHNTKKTNINAIEALLIPTSNGSIPLSALVETQVQSSTDSIQHEDADRIAKVTSALQPGFTTQRVLDAFKEELVGLEMKNGYTVKYGGEAQDVAKSFTDLYYAMVIGIFLIASILILQFNSYRQPFFILLALPLALIGVLPGLTITGQPLSFPAFIGIVALLGIVVNDAIILIDQINTNRRNGIPKKEAILKGGRSRLQPILLTTITTVAGILPLTLSDEVWGPLGFTIIFGLMFATVLTLMVIPILYNAYGEEELE
ncbi:MAG: efflux RND transporter permease subunit [Candidatus Gracilibacteria bacterium]|nr:efflux RND transporter permease subunit [Candidatus Gracilibacteria bacterium]